MPRSLAPELPASVLDLFSGQDLHTRVGLTVQLLTTDEAGWPHMAMLSVGELVADNARRLRAALWLTSSSTRNLEREHRALLAIVHDGAGYYVRLTARRGPDLDMGDDGRLATVALDIEDVQEDVVNYATLTSGIGFTLHQPDQVLARWQRTIAALRGTALPV